MKYAGIYLGIFQGLSTRFLAMGLHVTIPSPLRHDRLWGPPSQYAKRNGVPEGHFFRD
jgi:hypothetical protein